MAVEITSEGGKILLINRYAPNGFKNMYFEKIQGLKDKTIYEQVILVGDFNGMFDDTVERTNMKRREKAKKL